MVDSLVQEAIISNRGSTVLVNAQLEDVLDTYPKLHPYMPQITLSSYSLLTTKARCMQLYQGMQTPAAEKIMDPIHKQLEDVGLTQVGFIQIT